MFDTVLVACCALGAIVFGAWFAVQTKKRIKRAIACGEDIPRNAPMWDYIKDDIKNLHFSDAFHNATFIGVNGFIAILVFSALVSGLILPIVFGAILLVPIEVLYSKKVSAKSHRILSLVVY